ncbi:MAG: bifunctional homocysteine S-methyltransferase/methylenetetrahydrofolate reductase [Armatimonadetes bacterium]|nr:bifunctional homocysteine S-methyltransferase/methylenetetrahydrofolate reductase [Armatimonadota bacterium]
MSGSALVEALAQRVVIGDGAMGTQLVAHGVSWSTCLDELNLSQPNLVLAVHYEYRAAGAEVLETNTFGANRFKLARAGFERQVYGICTAGARLARQAAGPDAFVLGSIGPVGRAALDGDGPAGPQALAEAFAEQAEALAEGGVDALVLETFVSMAELKLAFRAVHAAVDLPVIAQFSVPDRVSPDAVDEVLRAMLELRGAGAAALGGNCGFGPLHLVHALERLAELTDAPLAAWPNSSFPEVRDGRYVFNDAAPYFVDAAAELAERGVGLLGGCCGTTPEHIRLLAQRLADRPAAARAVTATLPPPPPPPAAVVAARPPLTPLLEPIGCEPVIIVELDPPKGMDYHKVLDGARRLAEAGAHAVSVAENPLASIRMSSVALSYLIQQDAGVTAVCHITCRDRNLLGQQSELMGAGALGVNTILALTGDPVSLGGLSEATGVFDTNSFGLIEMLVELNEGRNALGHQLDFRTEFVIGVGFDPNVPRIEKAIGRLERKVALGAQFGMTQMVFDAATVPGMYEATAHLGIPIFAGFMPLVSARNARYLHNEVPGMRVPEAVQERLAAVDGDREASQAVGTEICREQIDAALKAGAPGIYLVTPFGRVEMMVELVGHVRAARVGGRRV